MQEIHTLTSEWVEKEEQREKRIAENQKKRAQEVKDNPEKGRIEGNKNHRKVER